MLVSRNTTHHRAQNPPRVVSGTILRTPRYRTVPQASRAASTLFLLVSRPLSASPVSDEASAERHVSRGQRMAIIDSNLLAALCQSQHATADPDCKAPPAQAPRIDGQGAAASVGGNPPSVSSSSRVEARAFARQRREHEQENGDSVELRARSAPAGLTRPLPHHILVAVDCASLIEPVQNVKPGATSEITFFVVRRAWPRRVWAGLTFDGISFSLFVVLSLHYQGRLLSCPSILSVTNAARCNKDAAYTDWRRLAWKLPAAGMRRDTSTFRTRFNYAFLPPAARSTSTFRSTRRAAASSPRGSKDSAACAQRLTGLAAVVLNRGGVRALSQRSSPQRLGERVTARSLVVCAPAAPITSSQPPALVQDGAEARSLPPPSTPPASPRACVPSSSRHPSPSLTSLIACGANGGYLAPLPPPSPVTGANAVQPHSRLASGGAATCCAQASICSACGAAVQLAVTAVLGRSQAQNPSTAVLSSRLRRARSLWYVQRLLIGVSRADNLSQPVHFFFRLRRAPPIDAGGCLHHVQAPLAASPPALTRVFFRLRRAIDTVVRGIRKSTSGMSNPLYRRFFDFSSACGARSCEALLGEPCRASAALPRFFFHLRRATHRLFKFSFACGAPM
ncbi:hypothetical protein AURDEDRAFT_177586 [Auricularia subglabra TFB-10046 SS5]|uniref:Uncharacterized protein n=1 Tax=Auricularia subglabra (strain TFB-10046 / SS5) TaxID=717982 RepID=J0WNB7_AURST|nr:hypothetical protein AURDEDRAFT_177586 [Auricularia subglabra TFB-10046 SS5]